MGLNQFKVEVLVHQNSSFIDLLMVKKYYKQFNLAYHPITNATQIKIKFCLLNWLSKGMISLVKNRETLTYS